MGLSRRIAIIGAALLFGLCLLFLRPRPRTGVHPIVPPAPPPRSAAEVALRRAAAYRTRAKIAASEARSDLEAWDPQGTAGMDAEAWRLQQLSADRDGSLRQARRWTKQAALLARTRADAIAQRAPGRRSCRSCSITRRGTTQRSFGRRRG